MLAKACQRRRLSMQPPFRHDHLVRSLNLSIPVRKKNPVKTQARTAQERLHSGTEYRKVWVCDSCTLENEDESARCSACGSFKPNNRRIKLTLAQKKGLVQAPPPKLSQNQWEECEAKAEERGDTAHPCSICREPFGLDAKVILSCSHMFHHNCLASFERFLRTNQRVCPLCRKQNYQKRLTKRGERIYRMQCAVKVQACVRRFLARKRYPKLLNEFYKSGRGSPLRRKTFYATKLSSISSRIVRAIDAREDSIDALLAEFDKSMSLSRQVLNGESSTTTASSCDGLMTVDKWHEALRKAVLRDEKECPICINLIDSATKPVTLLSCSHVLHTDCLDAFESFNIYEIHLCPVCRSHYDARVLAHDMTFALRPSSSNMLHPTSRPTQS
ncbi:hypothetical protein LEN26_014995 [Aphanomyces euteiches]|nr:hypothetical protein LEN26_014995 [Aphanomyces euteiches]